MTRDRVGLLWRPELAPLILGALDRIDVVEVIAEDWLHAGHTARRALRNLGAPVLVHGVSLGLASSAPVAHTRLDDLARLCADLTPVAWSEHLAFVRAGGIEIGHLAAPPRHPATLEGTLRNLERARRVVGSAPLLENVASLIDPPGSTMDETTWLHQIAPHAPLLLDLHNLHANAWNFGGSARDMLAMLPLDRVREVHLAGGRVIGGGRLLDDHLHDVPDVVYHLLEEVAASASEPLHVVVERDGNPPPFAELLGQLDRARAALERGRLRRSHEHRL